MKKFSILVLLSLIMVSCKSDVKGGIEKGKLNDDSVFFEYAIYFLDNKPENIEAIKRNIEKQYSEFKIIDSLPSFDKITESQLLLQEVTNVKDSFAAPDFEYLKYAGRGLSKQEESKIQNSNYVLKFDFFCDEKDLTKVMKLANNMVLEISKEYNAVIWDSETRETFSNQFWSENRVINDELIDVRKHITIHFYKKDDYCRAITLGMLKFGLPDIYIDDLSCYSNESVGSLINLMAQTFIENKEINQKGKINLNVNNLKNKELKDFLIETSYENGVGKATIDIVKGEWEDGDPENRLIKLKFSDENPQIEHDELIKSLFGTKDEISNISHDDKLLNASKRAKAKVPELKEKFQKGLPVGTHLLLKFPFQYDGDNNEWMWVEVVKWEGNTVKGILQNEPYYIPSLKAGQEVSKDIDLMFDYILSLPDGNTEGNETGKIIQEQQNSNE